MRVLALYYTHKPGGFCKRLYRLLGALTDREHQVLYLSLDRPAQALSSSVTWKRIPFPLQSRSGIIFWILFTVWCPIYSAWCATRFQPDRYLAFNPFYSAVLLFARIARPAPAVLFLRSLVFRINRVTAKSKLLCYLSDSIDRFGVSLASKVVCMTNAMRMELVEFLGWTPKEIEILPNDLPAFQAVAVAAEILPDKFNIVTAGVLDRRKNASLLIQAIALLPIEIQTRMNVLVVGEGCLSESLRTESAELSLSSLQFIGWRADLAPYLSGAQLLIHPSLHEGVSNTVMEALAADVPVIASNIPEHRELLISKELLFSVDTPKELAEILVAIIGDENKLPQISKLCKERAQAFRFDWDSRAVGLLTI